MPRPITQRAIARASGNRLRYPLRNLWLQDERTDGPAILRLARAGHRRKAALLLLGARESLHMRVISKSSHARRRGDRRAHMCVHTLYGRFEISLFERNVSASNQFYRTNMFEVI